MNTNALRRENGSPLRLGPKLKAGGEGTIYRVVGEAHLVAKIYHKYSPERTTKLRYMLDNPPNDPTRRQGHISIAWPTERIFDLSGRCVGFLMPSIDTIHSYPLLQLYNPRDRRQTLPGFNWLYLLRTARNLASVLQALHDKGYVLGDLNESNILVTSTALVTLVDCDSMQVRGKNQVFRCTVGKPEYTPPELQGCNFSQVERFPGHDNFALAVLIFLILMEGRHPFTGVWKGADPPPTLDQNIKARNFPYVNNPQFLPPRHALPFNILPPSLQILMRRSLTTNRARRPSAGTWFHALHSLEGQLEVCRINTQHIYSEHLQTCPWCERKQLSNVDPFPPTGNTAYLSIGRTARLARRRKRVRRLTNRTFGCIVPLVLLALEGIFWFTHQQLFNPWFASAQNAVKIPLLLAILVLPFVLSSLLRLLARTIFSM